MNSNLFSATLYPITSLASSFHAFETMRAAGKASPGRLDLAFTALGVDHSYSLQLMTDLFPPKSHATVVGLFGQRQVANHIASYNTGLSVLNWERL